MNKNTELELNTLNDKFAEGLNKVFTKENFPKFSKTTLSNITKSIYEYLEIPIMRLIKKVGDIARIEAKLNSIDTLVHQMQNRLDTIEQNYDNHTMKFLYVFIANIIVSLLIKYLL